MYVCMRDDRLKQARCSFPNQDSEKQLLLGAVCYPCRPSHHRASSLFFFFSPFILFFYVCMYVCMYVCDVRLRHRKISEDSVRPRAANILVSIGPSQPTDSHPIGCSQSACRWPAHVRSPSSLSLGAIKRRVQAKYTLN